MVMSAKSSATVFVSWGFTTIEDNTVNISLTLLTHRLIEHILFRYNNKDSPPAGNRKRRTTHSITCPGGGGGAAPHPDLARGYPILTWLGGGGNPSSLGQGVPILRYPPSQDWGIPPAWDWGTPPQQGKDLGPVTGVPPRKDMGPVEVLWDGDGTSGSIMGWRWGNFPPPPPGCEQTENITSRRTSYAVGKNRRRFACNSFKITDKSIYKLLTLSFSMSFIIFNFFFECVFKHLLSFLYLLL